MLVSICQVYSEIRYNFTQVTNVALRKAMVAGETLSPKIPDAKFSPTENARDSVSVDD